MALPVLDFWFDFASTYSYLAAMRIGPLAQKAEVRVRFRPFLLGPIFKAQGWSTSPFNLYPAKGRHMWRDLERSCAELQLAFRRPDPFPQNSLLAARVALVGLDQAWGEAFCRAMFRAQFADGRRIDDAVTVGDLLAGLKLDPDGALAAARRLRRAELHDRRRRTVLGQRPARAGAALGESRRCTRLRIEPHGQAGTGHVALGLGDAVLAEVEDRGRQHRRGVAVADALDQVLERAHPARGDHRHRHRIGDGAGERDVETLLGAVAVHGGQQDFAGAERDHLARVIDGVEPGGITAAVGEDLPALALVRLRHALGVDRNHDALVAEFFRRLLYVCRPRDRRGIDR